VRNKPNLATTFLTIMYYIWGYRTREKIKNYTEDAIGILGKRRAERQGPENMEMNKNKSRSFYTATSLCSSLCCSVPLFYCNLKPPSLPQKFAHEVSHKGDASVLYTTLHGGPKTVLHVTW